MEIGDDMKDVIFDFYIGDTYTRDFTLSGYSDVISEVFFTIKKQDDDKFYLIQKKLDDGITLTDVQYEDDGTTIKSRTWNLYIDAEDTEKLKPDVEYPFDIEIITPKDTTNLKKTLIKGNVVLNSATTRKWDEVN